MVNDTVIVLGVNVPLVSDGKSYSLTVNLDTVYVLLL